MSVQLRESIDRSEHTRYRICAETGLEQSSVSRFMAGKSSLSLEAVDALAAFLGLELQPVTKRTARKAVSRRAKSQ